MNPEELIRNIEKLLKNEKFTLVHQTSGYDGSLIRTYGKSGFEIKIRKPPGVPAGD